MTGFHLTLFSSEARNTTLQFLRNLLLFIVLFDILKYTTKKNPVHIYKERWQTINLIVLNNNFCSYSASVVDP